MNGLRRLFGHNVVAHTVIGKEFVGKLEQIPDSASAVTLEPLPDDVANAYSFAINGVSAIDVAVIAFVQDLAQPH